MPEEESEIVPRDGYDYPTTLAPLCQGAEDRGFQPLMKKADLDLKDVL